MHTLWSYDGENAIKMWTRLLWATCNKIQNEDHATLRRNLRQDVNDLADKLYSEQRQIHRILCELEDGWDRCMDTESRDQYYQYLSQLYLQAGGHWAGVQEAESGGGLYTLTHQVPAEDVPLWQRPEAHSERGRSKLFKG